MKKGSVIGFIILFISLNNSTLGQAFLQEKKFSLPLSFRDSIRPLRWENALVVDFSPVFPSSIETPFRYGSALSLLRSSSQRMGQVVSPGEVVDRWGFFCRQEWIMEKKIKVPVRFRLGTVSYVDYLEGKQKPLEWIGR